jgi:hypothetical protein
MYPLIFLCKIWATQHKELVNQISQLNKAHMLAMFNIIDDI